eukprot:GILK01012789.1.p1 GENE.GILK01012789.1~~GILK01012789.1.p1  ORF type:complete len:112 (-),score=31.40 GILK01012789.1:96-431(-)
MSETLRKLKIMTGTLRRLNKELASYHKEEIRERERLETIRSNGGDSHDLKKQEEVIGETVQMIPEVRRRLQMALEELQSFLSENEKDEDIAGKEELLVAHQIVNEVEQLFE